MTEPNKIKKATKYNLEIPLLDKCNKLEQSFFFYLINNQYTNILLTKMFVGNWYTK